MTDCLYLQGEDGDVERQFESRSDRLFRRPGYGVIAWGPTPLPSSALIRSTTSWPRAPSLRQSCPRSLAASQIHSRRTRVAAGADVSRKSRLPKRHAALD